MARLLVLSSRKQATRAGQVRADCPPMRLLEFLCSEAGTAVDRAAEQVHTAKEPLFAPLPACCGRANCPQ